MKIQERLITLTIKIKVDGLKFFAPKVEVLANINFETAEITIKHVKIPGMECLEQVKDIPRITCLVKQELKLAGEL